MKRVGSGHYGRVFYSYLLSFLLVLIVPVLMSLFVFQRANSVVTRESGRANEALLEVTGVYLDQLLEDVGQLQYLLNNSLRLESLVYESLPVTGNEYFRAWELVEDFQLYRDSSISIVDFYVYIPNLDLVLSPAGYFSTGSYHSVMRDGDFESYETWLERLHTITRQTIRTNRLALTPLTTDQFVPAIELVQPLPIQMQRSRPLGYAVLQIAAAPFEQPPAGSVWEDEALFLVADARSGILAASDRTLDVSALVEEYSGASTIPRTAEVELHGLSYVAFSRYSNSGFPWIYVALIPQNLYAMEFLQLQRFTIIAFILLTIVGGALIYVIATARYKPIRNLLAMLEPDVDGTFTLRSDEFDMIRSSLQSTLAEDRVLRQEAVESHTILRQRLLQQLLKGSIASDRSSEDRLRRMGFPVDLGHRALVAFEPDLMRRSLYPEIVAWLERATTRCDDCVDLVRDVDGTVCLIFAAATLNLDAICGQVSIAKRDLERQFQISCATGVSSVHRSIDGFAPLYQEARAALSYRLVKGDATPIRFEDVLTSGQTYDYPIDQENRLINSITSGALPSASAILDDVFEANFREAQLTVEMARCLMFDMIATMMKALTSLSSTDSDAAFWASTKPVSRLTSCHSLEQLKSEMSTILEAVCQHVNESRPSHAAQLCTQIDEIVQANLHDRNLGPELVADRLEMNSAYVGRLYREERGIGLSQHIKALRISEARSLLAESDPTVRQIADRLGFVDSNALIRAFKASEGVTPGEYRESHPQIAIPAPNTTDIRN